MLALLIGALLSSSLLVLIYYIYVSLSKETCMHVRVVQKSGHPRAAKGVRFFGPPCIYVSSRKVVHIYVRIVLVIHRLDC